MAAPYRSSSHGTPIEAAPVWVLAIVTGLIWLLAFPALVGLMHGFRLWQGERLLPALGAAAVAVALVVGLATRKPWRRPKPGELVDRRPFFARFSTWLIGVVLYPNLMVGAILLMRTGPPPDYAATAMLGVWLSAVQGILAWTSGRRDAKRGAAP